VRFDRPRPRNDPRKEEERILPLTNVVFLLLIFFMLAGRLAASDPFDVAPPHSLSEGSPESEELLVLIGADGRLALDGEPIEAGALEAAVAGRLAGSEGARRQVRVKADGGAEATQVVAVMERLREAGVERLELLAVPAQE